MKKAAIASAALLLLAGSLSAQEKSDRPEQGAGGAKPPRAETVKVPLEALGEILKRHPNGRMLSVRDWKVLLQ